jgi:hypothetical protein
MAKVLPGRRRAAALAVVGGVFTYMLVKIAVDQPRLESIAPQGAPTWTSGRPRPAAESE